MIRRIVELWRARELTAALVRSNLRIRYRRSTLGFLWSLLRPLLMMTVFTLVFSVLISFGVERYPLFFLSGYLPWLFLASSLTDAANILPAHEALIKRARFPRLALPVASVLSNLIHFLLALAMFSPFLFLLGPAPTARLALLPLAILVQLILVMGMAMLLSSFSVFCRDVEHVLDVLIMAWMYLSPIIYPVSKVPEQYLPFYRLNPMTPLIGLYRAALLGEALPGLGELAWVLALGLLLLVCGAWVFTRSESRFAKEL